MRDRFRVAMLASARLCTRRALLQNILFELKLPYRDRDEGELRLSLIDALEPSDECPHGMLLIVDEAHMLPLRLLEEIRMITNLVRQGQPRVRLVLAASMVLDERMASPRLESFNQRVAARCYLQSMNRDETCGYIRAQIGAVGGNPDRVFHIRCPAGRVSCDGRHTAAGQPGLRSRAPVIGDRPSRAGHGSRCGRGVGGSPATADAVDAGGRRGARHQRHTRIRTAG